MSISAAFNASRSGLAATSRWAEVTSTNISSADNPEYARRTLGRSTAETGVVIITGLQREVDSAMDRIYRREISRTATQQTLADGLSLYTDWLGDTDSATGLAAQLTVLQTSFDLLANAPGDATLQRNVVEAAQSMTLALNRTDAALRTTASDALEGLKNDVASFNQLLTEVRDLNRAIHNEPEGTARRATMEDQLAGKLDSLSTIAEISIRRDSFGRIDISTAGGTPLLEGEDLRTVIWDPGTQTLSANGIDITPGVVGARGFSDGSLAARITLVRDTLPKMQLQMDELARVLVQGFEAADASLAPGMAGLFTDGGLAYSGSVTGLAGRIGVNDAVRPELGGALWRLRDGIGAVTQGSLSDDTQVLSFLSVLDGTHSFDPATGQGADRSLKDYVAGILAAQQDVRVNAQQRHEGLAVGLQAIEASRQALQGVNIDDELQQLSDIERAYNANSQVLRSLSEMLDALLAAVSS